MLLETHHDRLANVITYFLSNTADCSAEKLMHLLYLLDFEHFKATGRGVTGNAYCALATGPVPAEVYFALNAPAGAPTILDDILDMSAWFGRKALIARRSFVDDDLTRRQMTLLEALAAGYHKGEDNLKNIVCAPDRPWSKCYRNGAGAQACIPYHLVLDGLPQRDLILESAHEHEMHLAAKRTGARS